MKELKNERMKELVDSCRLIVLGLFRKLSTINYQLSTILLFAFHFSLLAQPNIHVEVEPSAVRTEEMFEVKFIIENASVSNFTAPDFSGFNVMSGPNRMNSMTVINGDMKHSEVVSYTLMAKNPGSFTIGSAVIKSGNKNYSTNPVKIEVGKGLTSTEAQATKGQGNYFLRAEVSNAKPYIGEQILLDYKIYSLVNVSDIRQVSEPDYSNFSKIDLKDFPKAEQHVVLNGKTYAVKTLKRVALYPRKTGNLIIEPIVFRFDAPQRLHNRSKNNHSIDIDELDPFGLLMPHEPVELPTNTLNIDVQPIPQNGTNNAVVNVDAFEATLSPEKININDVAALRLKITFHGDASQFFAPELNLPKSLKTNEGKLIEEKTSSESGENVTIKTFEYLISSSAKNNNNFRLPTSTETFKVPITYFDTKQKKMVTVESQPLNLTIEDNGQTTTAQNNPLSGNNSSDKNINDSSLLWLLGGLGGALAGLFLYFRKAKKDKMLLKEAPFESFMKNTLDKNESKYLLEKTPTESLQGKLIDRFDYQRFHDPSILEIPSKKRQVPQSQSLTDKSIFELKNLEGLQNENPSLYLSQIQKKLTEFISYRIRINTNELNDLELKKKFSEKNISEEAQNKFFTVQNAIREAQFAGGSVDLKLINAQAQELIHLIGGL